MDCPYCGSKNAEYVGFFNTEKTPILYIVSLLLLAFLSVFIMCFHLGLLFPIGACVLYYIYYTRYIQFRCDDCGTIFCYDDRDDFVARSNEEIEQKIGYRKNIKRQLIAYAKKNEEIRKNHQQILIERKSRAKVDSLMSKLDSLGE